jgi:hypothetical protein
MAQMMVMQQPGAPPFALVLVLLLVTSHPISSTATALGGDAPAPAPAEARQQLVVKYSGARNYSQVVERVNSTAGIRLVEVWFLSVIVSPELC